MEINEKLNIALGFATVGGLIYLLDRFYPKPEESYDGSDRIREKEKTPKLSLRYQYGPIPRLRHVNDLKRWGTWAKRLYGKKKLSKLVEHGSPTTISLEAASWGVSPPKTEEEARKIARRGEKLINLYFELRKAGRSNLDRLSAIELEQISKY